MKCSAVIYSRTWVRRHWLMEIHTQVLLLRSTVQQPTWICTLFTLCLPTYRVSNWGNCVIIHQWPPGGSLDQWLSVHLNWLIFGALSPVISEVGTAAVWMNAVMPFMLKFFTVWGRVGWLPVTSWAHITYYMECHYCIVPQTGHHPVVIHSDPVRQVL